MKNNLAPAEDSTSIGRDRPARRRPWFLRFIWPEKRGARIRQLVGVALLVTIWGGGCGRMNGMFYWPNNLVYNDPARVGVKLESVTFASLDGTMLHGWFIPAQPDPVLRGATPAGSPQPGTTQPGAAQPGAVQPATTPRAIATVIYYHGNAQNLTAHYEFVSWLPPRGYNVFIFDYRGFGQSGGQANREGIFQDSVAALRYVRSRADVDPDRLVAYGQSLGGACLLAALGETDPHQVRAIAVDSTFYSYQYIGYDKIATSWWKVPLGWVMSQWFVTDEHAPAASLDRITDVPLLVMHGDADEIVPYHQGQVLFERSRAADKRFVQVPGGHHCDAVAGTVFGDKYRDLLTDFFAESLGKRQ